MRGEGNDRPRRTERGVAARLRTALSGLTPGHGAIVRAAERAWASVTFEGARHTFEIAFEGCEAIAAGERLIAELADHEFFVPGHLVADARVAAVDHRLVPSPRMVVTCELLVLKDA